MAPRRRRAATALAAGVVLAAASSCTGDPAERAAASTSDRSIDVTTLTGRLALSDGDDVYTVDADGANLRRLTHEPGPEFDPAWAPDGARLVYRDSRRGINNDDEIFVVNADGTAPTNLTRDPADDWGPDWSPDGRTIVFNSTRDGQPMGGYLIDPDGSDVRRIPVEGWIEYPTWSPDSRRIAFMGGGSGSDYDLWVVDVDGSDLVQLTDSPGQDGWPAWSPDGSRIAFSSVRDDCAHSDAADCRTAEEGDPHRDVWLVNPDGTGLTRVTSEFGQFVTWSPDGRYLLVFGRELFVIRPDGTGRTSVDIPGLPDGLFPDWIE